METTDAVPIWWHEGRPVGGVMAADRSGAGCDDLPPADAALVRDLVRGHAGQADPLRRAEGTLGRPPDVRERVRVLACTLAPPDTPLSESITAPFVPVAARRVRLLLTLHATVCAADPATGPLPAVVRILLWALDADNPWPAALVLASGLPTGEDDDGSVRFWPLAVDVLTGLLADEVADTLGLLSRQVRRFDDFYDGAEELRGRRVHEAGLQAHGWYVRQTTAALAPTLLHGTCACGRHCRGCPDRRRCTCCVPDHDLGSWEGLDDVLRPAEPPSGRGRSLGVFLAFAARGIATTYETNRRRPGPAGGAGTAAARRTVYGDAFSRSLLRDHLCTSATLTGAIEVVGVEFRRCHVCGNLWEQQVPDLCPAVRNSAGPCDTPDSRATNRREARKAIIVLSEVYVPVERVVCRRCANLFDPRMQAGGTGCPICGETAQVRCSAPGCTRWREITAGLTPCVCSAPLVVHCRGRGCRRRWDVRELARAAGDDVLECDRCAHPLLDSVQRATLQRCRTKTVRVLR